MSKVKIQGNALGTGTLTISAPNTNTNRSLTLPDGAGEILLANGDGSQLTNLPSGGKLLQVVSATTSVQESTSSSTFQTSAYCRASITPSATTSKIFVMASFQHYQSGDSADSEIGFRLIETNSSDFSVELRDRTYGYSGSGVLHMGETTITWLHSPSTTSERTYAVQFKKLSGANNCTIQDTGDGTVTLFEIDGS